MNMGKLVRDNMPDIWRAEGRNPVSHIADEAEDVESETC